jgi:general secretion pathway protein A
LAPSWQLPVTEGKSCETAADAAMGVLPNQQFDSATAAAVHVPGIVTLRLDDATAAYAVVVSSQSDTATLQLPSGRHTVRLDALWGFGRVNFATYWLAPPGLPSASQRAAQCAFTSLKSLSRQLASSKVPDRPPSPMAKTLDPALRKQLQDFQRAHGLKPDGQPGPITLMQIEQRDEVCASTTAP